jgi:hypothetical protein
MLLFVDLMFLGILGKVQCSKNRPLGNERKTIKKTSHDYIFVCELIVICVLIAKVHNLIN